MVYNFIILEISDLISRFFSHLTCFNLHVGKEYEENLVLQRGAWEPLKI